MTNKIWTAGSCLKKDMFSKLLDIFQIGGWTILTPNPMTAQSVNLYSPGISGDKHIYIKLKPFDGNTVTAPYDVRTTDYTDIQMEFGTSYNPVNDTMVTIGRAEIFSFIGGRNDSLSYSYGRVFSKEFTMKYWYYVDRDRLIFISQPDMGFTDVVKTYTTFNYLGIPEESYLKEHLSPVYMGTVLIKSHTGFSTGKGRVLERPAILPRENTNVSTTTYVAKTDSTSPNVEGVVELTEVYTGAINEGTRARLGGFYVCATGANLLDGDTVEVQDITGTHTYLYKPPGPQGASVSSFPLALGFLIRIS